MGWYYQHGTITDVITEIVSDQRVEKHRKVGTVLYTVERNRDGRRYAGVYLLESQGREFGYKPMDETVGPYYYGFPKAWLADLDPPLNTYAEQWRAKVRAL